MEIEGKKALKISVKDTGVGMATKDMNRIFQMF